MRRTALRGREGFTLVELLIALTIFGVIFGAAMAMMGQQVQAFSRAGDASSALQNERFSIEQIERALRAAGIGLAEGQPMLVYADSSTIAVNGDYASNTPGDLDAIFINTGLSDAASTALGQLTRITIPGTSFRYPDTTYGGGTSPAETIIFFFQPDSTTARTDDYILFRQVNGQAPEVVARDLVHNGNTPFFQYLRVLASSTTAPHLDSVLPARLPLAHTAPLHLAAGDTAPFTTIDSIYAVRVRLTATNGVSGPRAVSRPVSRLLRLPNAGMQAFQTCGNQPAAPQNFALSLQLVNGSPVPELSWTASADENAGEKDVVRYVIYRIRGPGLPAQMDGFFNLPANRSASYVWDDTRVEQDSTYSYAVAAEDCTPQVGTPTAAATITVH